MTTVIFLESGEGLSSLRVLNIASLLLAVVVGPLLAASFPSPLSSAQPSLSPSLGGAYLLWPLSSSRDGGRQPKESTGCHSNIGQHGNVNPDFANFFRVAIYHSHKILPFSFTRTQCGFSWDRSVGRSSLLLSLPPNSVVSVGGGVGRNQRSLQPRDKMYIRGGFSGMSQCIFGE